MKKTIKTDLAPQAIGPYSQGIIVGDILFTSGQIGLIPDKGELAEGIEAQTTQVMENIKSILQEAGLDFSKVVKTTIFLSDIKNFNKVNEIYAKYFTDDPPARSCFEVACLPKEALIEIEVIAHR
jgi:2-iminobutanoate/2-iminopropanoate deaminase